MTFRIAALLAVLIPVAGAQQFDAPPANCGFAGKSLPKDVRVLAAGGYGGRKLDHQIDQSGSTATQFDVAVNSPGEPVALMLGAYEPTIWNVGWTRGTRIVAVIVSGYHRQAIAGLDSDVPVIDSTHENKGPCGYFYVGSDGRRKMNELSLELFGKSVEQTYSGGRDGRIVVGQPMASSAGLLGSRKTRPESFYDRSAPRAGKAGIDDALAKGLLRLATSQDIDAWMEIAGPGAARPPPSNSYVVLSAWAFPPGLKGKDAARFFVPLGEPMPMGGAGAGDSAVYDFRKRRCQGKICE